MRKQLRSALIASAALMMLAIPPSWAQQQGNPNPGQGNPNPGQGNPNPGQGNPNPGQGNPNPGKPNIAPEINVGAGGAGLTVLAIALLLAAERRSRSS